LWAQSPAAHASNFSTPDCKKNSVGVIVICSDHGLLWWDSYKGIDHALTPDESILHKMMIIISFSVNGEVGSQGPDQYYHFFGGKTPTFPTKMY